MRLPWLDDESTPLPAPETALGGDSDAPGLLAAGGRLTTARLREAYAQGIFPWFGPGQPVLWWSPDPRMVLPVAQLRLSHSLRKTIRRFRRDPRCSLRFDHAFAQVIAACAGTPREGQDGTWIVPPMVDAYTAWHREGVVHSVETWVDGELAGGLYFVAIGRMVFGESMFSHRPDASKIALAALAAACLARGVPLIDCQQNTGHLASLGAHEIPRAAFRLHLSTHVGAGPVAPWSYDEAAWDLLDPRLAPLPGADEQAPSPDRQPD